MNDVVITECNVKIEKTKYLSDLELGMIFGIRRPVANISKMTTVSGLSSPAVSQVFRELHLKKITSSDKSSSVRKILVNESDESD